MESRQHLLKYFVKVILKGIKCWFKSFLFSTIKEISCSWCRIYKNSLKKKKLNFHFWTYAQFWNKNQRNYFSGLQLDLFSFTRHSREDLKTTLSILNPSFWLNEKQWNREACFSDYPFWFRPWGQRYRHYEYTACNRATCRLVAKIHDRDLEGWWFRPPCSHNKTHTAIGPLSKALNRTLLLEWLFSA